MITRLAPARAPKARTRRPSQAVQADHRLVPMTTLRSVSIPSQHHGNSARLLAVITQHLVTLCSNPSRRFCQQKKYSNLFIDDALHLSLSPSLPLSLPPLLSLSVRVRAHARVYVRVCVYARLCPERVLSAGDESPEC